MALTEQQSQRLGALADFLLEPWKDPFGRDFTRIQYLLIAIGALDHGEMGNLYNPLAAIQAAVANIKLNVTSAQIVQLAAALKEAVADEVAERMKE